MEPRDVERPPRRGNPSTEGRGRAEAGKGKGKRRASQARWQEARGAKRIVSQKVPLAQKPEEGGRAPCLPAKERRSRKKGVTDGKALIQMQAWHTQGAARRECAWSRGI